MLQILPYLAQLALQTITHQVYACIPAEPQHRVSSSAGSQWSTTPWAMFVCAVRMSSFSACLLQCHCHSGPTKQTRAAPSTG